ncbi:hypothetical protein JKY72_03395 [Candidatus Gracilibacteria bacterium]|nr:hypothetical protein [Candidatus Gracilibacteria bacterium]
MHRKVIQALENRPSSYDDSQVEWIAPEYIRHYRGNVWKTISFAIVVISAILAFLYGSWTFSLAIITSAVVYYIVHIEHPKEVTIKISKIGIKVGSRKYAFTRIKGFWTIYDPPYVRTLHIRVAGEMITDITIQLGQQDPAEVRELLMSKIPEFEGKTENLSDLFIRLFRL